jgi:ribosomal protein L11 methyltransferase
MDTWFSFKAKQGAHSSFVIQELASYDLQHISLSEEVDTGDLSFYAMGDQTRFPPSWENIASYKEIPSEIDWTAEWASYSPYFQEGKAVIPLQDFLKESKEIIHLLPGPGFGDLSHPTTELSLKLLANYCYGTVLIDLGCGSGILGIAALKWGALFVHAIDIDENALTHTKKNAEINQVDLLLSTETQLSSCSKNPTLLVMNMTFEEQKMALKSLPLEVLDLSYLITSGILESQKEKYLSWAKQQGWTLQSHLVKEGWIGCVFTSDSLRQL